MAKGKKTGGRKAGTPNKKTAAIKEAFTQLLNDNLDNMGEWLERVAKTDPVKALDIMAKFSEYCIPKLNRTTHEGEVSQNIVVKKPEMDEND